ncbi:Uncharacterised protein [Vibrio cholerae]|nr:Uncharacterised protein [Vibrio cholerae]CSI78477.1 Uncharacterised protein [Vibrio cholerae]
MTAETLNPTRSQEAISILNGVIIETAMVAILTINNGCLTYAIISD